MTTFNSPTPAGQRSFRISLSFSAIVHAILVFLNVGLACYTTLQARVATECRDSCRVVEERMSFLEKEALISNRQVMSAMGMKGGRP